MGYLYLERKRRDKAMVEWHKALALDPKILSKNVTVNLISSTAVTMERRYFTARLLASVGDVESTIENLQMAITDGFSNLESIRKEPDFDPIRNNKRFIEFLENAETMIKLRSKTGLPEERPK
jgi:tetratricopeptide (TPR) repeat protein